MIKVPVWLAGVLFSLLLGVGVGVGYLTERTVGSIPMPSVPSKPMGFFERDPTPPTGERDPVMQAGAAFMARVTEYKQRLDKNPQDLEALIFLGNANYDITRFKQASEYYERVLRLDPANIHVRTDLATSYYGTGQIDRALEEIRVALKHNPKHETALFNLGVILLEGKSDAEGAVEAWEILLREHPDNPRSHELRLKIAELRSQS